MLLNGGGGWLYYGKRNGDKEKNENQNQTNKQKKINVLANFFLLMNKCKNGNCVEMK